MKYAALLIIYVCGIQMLLFSQTKLYMLFTVLLADVHLFKLQFI